MAKFKNLIFIVGGLLLCIVSALATYFGLAASGVINPDAVYLEFTIQDEEKIYDGEALVASAIEYDETLILEGHTVKITYLGSQEDVGVSKSDANISIVDSDGVDVTKKYMIKVNQGNLEVTKKEITVSLENQEVEYNGQSLSVDSCDVTEGELVIGHKVIPTVTGTIVNVGDKIDSSTVDFRVFDATGNNVTKNYDVTAKANTENISILPRKIVIRSLSSSKTYDGTPLYAGYEIVSGSMADGQKLNVEFSNSYITNVGTTHAEITDYSITDLLTNTEVLQDNYQVTILDEYEEAECGLLTINKRNLFVNINSYTKTYDGLGVSQSDLSYTIDSSTSLADGQTFSLVYKPNPNDASLLEYCMDVGHYGLQGKSYKIIGSDGETTSNYEVQINDSSITITKANLTVVAQAGSYSYDSVSHAIENPSPTIYGLVSSNHEVSNIVYSYDGSTDADVSEVGIYEIKVESLIIKDKANNYKDVSKNYNLLSVANSFEIKKASLFIYLNNYEKTYDGEPVVEESNANDIVAAMSSLPSSLRMRYPYDNTVKTYYKVGTYEYYAGYKIYAKDKNATTDNDSDYSIDVTDNFDIIEVPGTIKILSPEDLIINLPNLEKTYDGDSIYEDCYSTLEQTINDYNNLSAEYTITIDNTTTELQTILNQTNVGKGSYTLDLKVIDSLGGISYESTPIINVSSLTISKIDILSFATNPSIGALCGQIGSNYSLDSDEKYLKLESSASVKISDLLFVVDTQYVTLNSLFSTYKTQLLGTGHFSDKLYNKNGVEISSTASIDGLEIDLARSGLTGSSLAIYAIKNASSPYIVNLTAKVGVASATDVTDMFNLVINPGTMAVNLEIQLTNYEWTYDGKSFLAHNYNLASNPAAEVKAEKVIDDYADVLAMLPAGTTIVLDRDDASYIGSFTNVNAHDNGNGIDVGEEYTASFKFYDSEYNDITDTIGVVVKPGTILIKRREINVDYVNNTVSTTYNGKAYSLTQDDIILKNATTLANESIVADTEFTLPDGFTIEQITLGHNTYDSDELESKLTYYDGLTPVEGIKVTSLKIFDTTTNDVTSNFSINYTNTFQLTVKRRTIYVNIKSMSIIYNIDVVDAIESGEISFVELDPSSVLADGDYISSMEAELDFTIDDTTSDSYVISDVSVSLKNESGTSVSSNYQVVILGNGILTVTV